MDLVSDQQSACERDLSILTGIIAASADACWCMEFTEPVDLLAPEREIVRQIFENKPVWRYCNEAMSRLYRLPADMDINSRPVHEIFPRNAQNEAFSRDLIKADFNVDAAPALDRRYDGARIYVENDVRAHIEGGKLLRLFGVVRDVSKLRRREGELKSRASQVAEILSATVAPILVRAPDNTVAAANPAACVMLAVSADRILGRDMSGLIAPEQLPASIFEDAFERGRTLCVQATMLVGPVSGRLVEIHVSPMVDAKNCVVTIIGSRFPTDMPKPGNGE